MTEFIVIVKLDKNKHQIIKNEIEKKYKKTQFSVIFQKENKITMQISINSSDSKEIIENVLNAINGASVITVESMPSMLSKLPRTFSMWIMVGMFITWFTISAIAFNTENNIIDNMSPSELLVIQVSIALVISIWIFSYDRKSQKNIVDVLGRLDLRTSEINENVKDLDDKN